MSPATFALVGSRTTRERNARGEGITVFRWEATTGALTRLQVLGGLVNPAYLCANAAGDRVYAVHGDGETMSAFAFDPVHGALTPLNAVASGGRNPVHLALDPHERFLIVTNHLSHNVSVLPVTETGALQPPISHTVFEGAPGPHRIEQPFSKPHANPFDPSGRFVIVPDKGLDAVFSLRFEHGAFDATRAQRLQVREGAGPRHAAFHPRLPFVYVVNELDSTLSAMQFDPATGVLTPLQIVSTLNPLFTGNNRAAGIAIHPNGRTLYASNRGEDSIAVYAVDVTTGLLSRMQSASSGGRTPRFFTLDPAARWLYALNEDSDTLVRFSVDPASGTLSDSGEITVCASPTCMIFA
jgi:6-phosphogluconolactonase